MSEKKRDNFASLYPNLAKTKSEEKKEKPATPKKKATTPKKPATAPKYKKGDFEKRVDVKMRQLDAQKYHSTAAAPAGNPHKWMKTYTATGAVTTPQLKEIVKKYEGKEYKKGGNTDVLVTAAKRILKDRGTDHFAGLSGGWSGKKY